MRFQLAALAVAGVVASGCASIRPVAAPREFIPREQPEIVWVTWDVEDRVFAVANPSLRNDTIVGLSPRLAEPVAIPLPEARVVVARQSDKTRTFLLAASVGVAAGFVVWRAGKSGGRSSGCAFDAGNNRYDCP